MEQQQAEQPPAKQARIGTMPSEQKRRIEDALEQLGEVEYKLRPHRKGAGPVRPKTLSPEESVHEKQGEIRQGAANRVHYVCSNEKCKEPIRKDKWDTHVSAQLMMTLRAIPIGLLPYRAALMRSANVDGAGDPRDVLR